MVSIRKCLFALIILVVVLFAGISFTLILNCDFGSLDIKTVTIQDGNHEISGLLYQPHTATAKNLSPAIVLVHGISSSKQSMSSIALELARRGFVTLSIDLVGHGESGGELGANGDLSLGTLAAIKYIKSQVYVNASSIGLVGHSLGAGAIRAAVAVQRDIKALVLIAGGFGDIVADPAYGTLNSTFPKNLLVAIGRQDVLFELPQVTKEWLPPIFGVSQEVVPESQYGNFSSGTARKLVTPKTTHLLEPLDPTIISETINWLNNALKFGNMSQSQFTSEGNFIYFYREAAMLLSVFSFVGLVFPVSLYVYSFKFSNDNDCEADTKYGYLEDWKITVIWGALSIMLFFPMIFVGFVIPFPPLLFGSSIAWWLIGVAFMGFLLIFFAAPNFFNIMLRMRTIITESFTWRGVSGAIGLFLLLYLIVYLMDYFLGINLWIFVPIFRVIRPVTRIPVFFSYIPFFLVFFFVEGLILHTLRKPSEKTGFFSNVLAMIKTIGIKTTPYLVVMGIQYIPMFLLEVKPLPSFVGFLIEFLPLLTLQFVISTAYSWWFHKITFSVGTGAIFNAFLFAWISANAFPFGVFR